MKEEYSLALPDLSDLGNSAVWMVRYMAPSGFICQLSLEARSGSEVLLRGQLAMVKLLESGCIPVERKLDTVQPTQGKDDPVVCPIHKTTMHLCRKGERSWHAHKLENGKWCTGKGEKA
jgi:hypothetical protein